MPIISLEEDFYLPFELIELIFSHLDDYTLLYFVSTIRGSDENILDEIEAGILSSCKNFPIRDPNAKYVIDLCNKNLFLRIHRLKKVFPSIVIEAHKNEASTFIDFLSNFDSYFNTKVDYRAIPLFRNLADSFLFTVPFNLEETLVFLGYKNSSTLSQTKKCLYFYGLIARGDTAKIEEFFGNGDLERSFEGSRTNNYMSLSFHIVIYAILSGNLESIRYLYDNYKKIFDTEDVSRINRCYETIIKSGRLDILIFFLHIYKFFPDFDDK